MKNTSNHIKIYDKGKLPQAKVLTKQGEKNVNKEHVKSNTKLKHIEQCMGCFSITIITT